MSIFLMLCGLVLAQDPPAKAKAPEPKPTAEDLLKLRCQKEWPTDFSMQKYCLERQRKGAKEVFSYMEKHHINLDDEEHTDPREVLVVKCYMEWSDTTLGADWSMWAYCINRQETALKALGR